jgi:hypothetical protein
MSRFCFAVLFLLAFLGALGLPQSPAQAQQPTGADTKQEAALQKLHQRLQEEALRRMQQLLDEVLVETAPFQTEMPLEQFLAALEKKLPRGKKVTLRIDREAFGTRLADVAAMPMVLPPAPPRTSLRRALEAVLAKSKTPLDYRLDAEGAVLTTPQRALYTTVYEIRDIVEKPAGLLLAGTVSRRLIALGDKEPLSTTGPASRAALVVESLATALDPDSPTGLPADPDAIQVLNGDRLVIRANAARHAQMAEMLQAIRRLSDLAVIVNAKLYEVDRAFYTRLQNTKRLSINELEELDGKGASEKGDTLFNLLPKHKLVLAGEEVKGDNGQEVALLSRHRVVRCLPGPDQARRGVKARQTVLDGVSFGAAIQVSPDRRFVRLKLTETASDLQAIDRVKVRDFTGENEVEAESPFLKESTHSQVRDVPDCATLLVPVHYRPQSLQARERWWVLSVTPRIFILEEERELRKMRLRDILPALIPFPF